MRRLQHALVVLFAGLAACTNDPENPLKPGQDDFVSIERDYNADYAGMYGMADSSAGTSAPTAEAGRANDGNNAPSGREGTVEEADIYRVDGTRLFYLNTYRGFIIYDLANPAAPQRVSRLPVHGYPIEMFVDGNTVYALLRDALYVTQSPNGLQFKRHQVSQLVAIDITDISNPHILKTIDIVGQLREGVSRKIDDTIYVVSHLPQSYYYRGYPYGGEQAEQAWVYSFNVADPASPQLVEKLKIFEGGGYSNSSNNSYSGRYFSGVAISATSNTLHVVENWYSYGSVYGNGYSGCGSYQSFQEAVVSVVDISDPTGAIRLHSRFSTYGHLTDQFKHTYVYDDATQKGYYLGIFARQEWHSINCNGGQFIQNAIEAWDVTDGANPVRVSSLKFGKPNETVRGSAFDADKRISYAITAQRVDPLYAISYADPTNLHVLSEIDGLSGDMNLFRLIDGGKFLLAIGTDNSDTCTGFGSPTTGWSTNTAVSVIDVQNPAAMKLVQRRCVTVDNAYWTWSEINQNLDQAHKMIGLSQDDRASVVSVPVNYYSRADESDGWWWYRPQSAVGLMSFDLGAYDPTKSHTEQTVLKNHGTVVHPSGHVRRSIIFPHPDGRRLMVNLSETHVGVVDIDNLDQPEQRAVIEVAPYHARLYTFGSYIVDEVQTGEGRYWGQGSSEFRVKHTAPGLDEAEVVATVKVSRVQQVVQWKNLLVAFRTPDEENNYYSRVTEAVVIDFSNPASPVIAGSARLPMPDMPYVYYGCFGWGWWPSYSNSSWAQTDQGIGFLSWSYTNNNTAEQRLVFLNLTVPAAPHATYKALVSGTYQQLWGDGSGLGKQYTSLVGHPAGLWVNSRERAGGFKTVDGSNFAVIKNRVEAINADLTLGHAVNVAGEALRIEGVAGQERFVTKDQSFTASAQGEYTSWSANDRLHLLRRTGPSTAVLKGSKQLTGSLSDLVGDGDRLYVTSRPQSYYYGYYYDVSVGGSTTESSDRLSIFDLTGDALNQRFSAPVGHYGSQLMGVYNNHLFINISGDGVLAVDVSNAGAPQGRHFVRTLGWATHLVFEGTRAFIAAGNFGIYELDLGAAPTIARLN